MRSRLCPLHGHPTTPAPQENGPPDHKSVEQTIRADADRSQPTMGAVLFDSPKETNSRSEASDCWPGHAQMAGMLVNNPQDVYLRWIRAR